MQPINSRQNERFKTLLEAKKDKDLLMLEGRRLALDALSRGYKPVYSAITPQYIELHGTPQFDFILLSEDLFSKISDTQTPQGIIVFIGRPYKSIDDLKVHDRLVILDGLQDPGNVGTIVRTAEAFGFEGVIVTPGTASPFSEKAVRASMGSVLGIDVAQAEAWDIASLDPAPETEMTISSPRPGWAEQDPETWWKAALACLDKIKSTGLNLEDIEAVGISYQMHGLVAVDKKLKPLRPSIIWCDSRAVAIGEKAFDVIGHDLCLKRFMNSPGNFTASKLAWVRSVQAVNIVQATSLCGKQHIPNCFSHQNFGLISEKRTYTKLLLISSIARGDLEKQVNKL